MAEGEAHRKKAVVRGLLVASALAAALVLVLYPGRGKPAAPGARPTGGDNDVVLPDPPGPVLLRWKFPAGQTLTYALTGKETERLGLTSWVTLLSGTLRLRGLGNGEGEADLVLVRSAPGVGGSPSAGGPTAGGTSPLGAGIRVPATTPVNAEPGTGGPPAAATAPGRPHPRPLEAGAQPARPGTRLPLGEGKGEGTPGGAAGEVTVEAPPAGALRQSFTVDSQGRLVGSQVGLELLLTVFGVDFSFPEEGLYRARPASSKKESPLGLGGAGLLTRRHTWTRTVEHAGYPCLQVEGTSYEDASAPVRGGQRLLTTRTGTNLCYFTQERGFLVEWAVDRTEETSSSGEAGAGFRARTIYRTQQVSLKLTEVREEGPVE